MRSAVAALAWEFWSANRRGWLLVVAVIPVCALLYRLTDSALQQSDGLRFLSFLPMVISLILTAAFCNFTDQDRRDGIAGFPRHLFVLPVPTRLLVTCAMACGVLSVVGVFLAWAMLVFQPLDIELWVRWPATLIAAGVVFYHAIVWCLCGFRLTRMVSLSLVATVLVGVGFLPMLLPKTSIWAKESSLSAALAAVAAVAYGATLVTVGLQRRGGGRGWTWIQTFVGNLTIVLPHRRAALKSADAALFWIEWRCAGLVLPVAVVLLAALILGALIQFTNHNAEATVWAESWLAIAPILLAFPIGMGFGKPDFWSLDLRLSPFVTARPITGGQLLAAKIKAAACSTLLAWMALLLFAPICIYLYCDTEHWLEVWRTLGLIYSPYAQWAVPILALVAAMTLTWSLLIGSMWLGYSGRTGYFYSFVSVGMAGFLATLIFLTWWQDHPNQRGDQFAKLLSWLPWALAAVVTVKAWFAALCARRLLCRRLISNGSIVLFVCGWLIAVTCLMLCAWLLSPRIEWIRNMLILAGLCAIPAARLAATPLAIAWNRHR